MSRYDPTASAISKALKRLFQLFRAIPDVRIERDPLPTEPELERLRIHLYGRIASDPFNTFIESLFLIPTTLSNELEARALSMTLSVLNQAITGRPVRSFAVPEGRLLIGTPWWSQHIKFANKDWHQPISFDVDDPFTNLRLVPLQESEWIDPSNVDRSFRGARLRRSLRIALAPLGRHIITEFSGTKVIDNSAHVFGFRSARVSHVNGMEEYERVLRGTITKARAERVDILCFPELSVCEQGRKWIREELERDSGDVSIVFPGSFHVTSEKKWWNRAPIWLVSPGSVEEVGSFAKISTFSFSVADADKSPGSEALGREAKTASCTHLQEHISLGAAAAIIDTPVGFCGVLICKDVLGLTGDVVRRTVESADHLFTLSFTPSAGWFAGEAEKFVRYNAATYFVNSRQVLATNPNVPLAFARVPKGSPALEIWTDASSQPPGVTLADEDLAIVSIPLPLSLE